MCINGFFLDARNELKLSLLIWHELFYYVVGKVDKIYPGYSR